MDFLAKLYEDESKLKQENHKKNLAMLQRGTILFYSSVYHHTYMYIGNVYGIQHCRVHARSGMKPMGVYIDKMPESIKATTVFRCKNISLTYLAVDYVLAWAFFAPELYKEAKVSESRIQKDEQLKRKTAFSMDRYSNLVEPTKPADPFTVASLRRAFKYASRRYDTPLSKDKGTTCTTLLIAAYQAAVLQMYFKSQYGALHKAAQELKQSKYKLMSAEDAWIVVCKLHLPKTQDLIALSKIMPASLLLESKTANAGSPWRDMLRKDGELWQEIKLISDY